MARVTVTTTPQKVADGPAAAPARGISFGIVQNAATGVVQFEKSRTGSAPTMTNATRIDFSKIPGLSYTCGPGISLWAQTASGTVDIDILEGGEQ